MQHAVKTGLLNFEHFKGENSAVAKLNWKKVAEIRQRCGEGEAKRKLAREFKVSPRTIRDVVADRTWISSRLSIG